jgi:hypothetical protein
MKKEILLQKLKNIISSIGWKLFIWGLGISQEEYWGQIYEQELNFKTTQSLPKE